MTQEPKRYNRSISQLKSLGKCGTAFDLERLHRKEIQRRPAAWSISGSAFHDALMDWEKSERTLSLAELFEQHYDRIVAEEIEKQPDLSVWMKPPRTKSTEQDIKNYRKRFLEKDIPNYEQRCREAEWEILRFDDGRLAIELEFELEVDGILIKGALDRIQWWPNDEIATMEDTKTGSPENHESDIRQLGLYKVAAEAVWGIGLTYGRYWFTKLDRPSAWYTLDRFTMEYFEQEFRKAESIIEQRLFLPNPGKHCDLCPVQPWCPEKGYLKLGEKMNNVG